MTEAAMNDPHPHSRTLTLEEEVAFQRTIGTAMTPFDQGRIAANFILAWKNARAYGGFDLASLSLLDEGTFADLIVLLPVIRRTRCNPEMLGLGEAVMQIVKTLRPLLAE